MCEQTWLVGIINGAGCVKNPAMHVVCACVSDVRAVIVHVATNGKTSNCDICKYNMMKRNVLLHTCVYCNDLNNGACRFRQFVSVRKEFSLRLDKLPMIEPKQMNRYFCADQGTVVHSAENSQEC